MVGVCAHACAQAHADMNQDQCQRSRYWEQESGLQWLRHLPLPQKESWESRLYLPCRARNWVFAIVVTYLADKYKTQICYKANVFLAHLRPCIAKQSSRGPLHRIRKWAISLRHPWIRCCNEEDEDDEGQTHNRVISGTDCQLLSAKQSVGAQKSVWDITEGMCSDFDSTVVRVTTA